MLHYMYITKTFGIAALTPQTMLTKKAPIKDVKINIVREEGEGERAA